MNSNMAKDCAFCNLPSIRERAIVRNELVWCFLTETPIVPGHVLICPVRCVETIEELTEAELQSLLEMRLKVKNALIKVFNAEGFNYAWNEGIKAGQTVPHLHLHVVPRSDGDAGIYEYEPRKFLYRPGSREKSSDDELAAITKEISEVITHL